MDSLENKMASSATLKQVLDSEDYVPVPPDLTADPFYRIAYLIKQEIRKFKWIEAENGNDMTWEEARRAWSERHFNDYDAFLKHTLKF